VSARRHLGALRPLGEDARPPGRERGHDGRAHRDHDEPDAEHERIERQPELGIGVARDAHRVTDLESGFVGEALDDRDLVGPIGARHPSREHARLVDGRATLTSDATVSSRKRW
jgi:hypothetical protein